MCDGAALHRFAPKGKVSLTAFDECRPIASNPGQNPTSGDENDRLPSLAGHHQSMGDLSSATPRGEDGHGIADERDAITGFSLARDEA